MPICVRVVKILSGYKTIKSNNIVEETEKRSKFISYAFRVYSEEDVRQNLKNIKSKHWDAKHHVYAYRLKENFQEKFSDDGEPSGTAGMPVMNAIKSLDLQNVLVIVVRYFGGILLGTSGLRKMYGSGALKVLQNAEISEMNLCSHVNINCNYKDHNKISYVFAKYNAKVNNIEYLDQVKFDVYVKKCDLKLMLSQISDITKNGFSYKILEESYQVD